MSRSSPIAAGFRAVTQNPWLIASEIAWRWSFALAVWLLLAFTFFTYLHSLRVSSADLLLLKTRVPPLMAQAIGHILEGSGGRLLRAAAVLLPTISFLWIVAASVGRWVSLQALLEDVCGSFRTVLELHFLRAAAALAAWFGYFGALLFAGLAASRGYEDRPGFFLLIFFIAAGVIGFFHGQVRWFLSLATIVAAREGAGALAAISGGYDAYRQRRREFASAGAAIWAMRVSAIVLASIASLLPMVGLDAVRWKTAAVAVAIITLAYFIAADLLQVVRLAAYVEILREGPEPAPPAIQPEPAAPAAEDAGPTPLEAGS